MKKDLEIIVKRSNDQVMKTQRIRKKRIQKSIIYYLKKISKQRKKIKMKEKVSDIDNITQKRKSKG